MADEVLQPEDVFFETPLRDLLSWALLNEPVGIADVFAAAANKGDVLAARWIRRLYQHGVTNSLLMEVRGLVQKVDRVSNFELDISEDFFYWTLERPQKNYSPDRETVYAMMVASIINGDLADSLKRCEAPDCDNYYFAGDRGKWCSKRCGSRTRVRKKRELDRQRQAMNGDYL